MLDPFVREEEFERRYRAFDGGAYDNLHVRLHGHLFRIDKRASDRQVTRDDRWGDFTEEAYRALLVLAKERGYTFSGYCTRAAGRHVVWRHDVDISMHRALRLAEIEAEEGIISTYFVNAHCAFYNLLETEIRGLIRRIGKLGHRFGLHFDAAAYPGVSWTEELLSDRLVKEKELLRSLLDVELDAYSYHNPAVEDGLMRFDSDLAGMVNAYGREFQNSYTFVSDSNGYWRHRPIGDVIDEGKAERLQVLTHPVWWTPKPLPPRGRIQRAVYGRAAALMENYDQQLKQHGRDNIHV